MTLTGCKEVNSSQPNGGVSISSTTATPPNDEQDEDAKIREIAWDSLSARQQESVQGNWKTAEVERLQGNSIWYGIAMDEQSTQIPDQVILVTFNTTQDQLLGPLVIYIDAESEERIGVGVRE
ncbi:hypothetical protein [Saccharibacillus sacchari]|uniref:hypothetical protein n=1 Tax=Saccharibacillus sacchari TaxID=456493 RepID=UPI0004B988B7|nr:hypothetical protein [Saccharibacillus sacchari]